MEQRDLGRTGLKVSALGFGCGAVGGLMVRGQPAERRRPSEDGASLELHPSLVPALRAAGLEVDLALSFNVFETRPDGEYLRELKLALVRPETFDPEVDV